MSAPTPLARKAGLIAFAIATALLLGWLATSQGPLAPTRVTLAKVQQGPLVASTFGIGTVEARRSYALGPTTASRVARVLVDQGDVVKSGQLLAELDPVDLDDRVVSGRLAAQRAASTVRAAQAQVAEAKSRAQVASASARRSAELRARGFFSHEASDARQQEADAATAAVDASTAQLAAARRDHERALADVAGVGKLRAQARLTSPVDGVVSARLVEPGTTIVAGQAVVQVIDPASLWVKARIDQGQAGGVRVGQPAAIVLRSAARRVYRGEVQRVDWVSDAVTEERIVNVGFAARPEGISVGELVEVTITTAELSDARWLPAAAVKRVDQRDGVWQLKDGRVAFQPLAVGITTLDGRSQILDGLATGEDVVVYSEQALKPDAKVQAVAAIVGAGR
ncbi:MAG TPA: efflux RND transporter periplasmic adaptor subunit [Accumulibacter sp.]|uniref:efflux RND transporter periplasmic adaptor subunit n=1 Tax=Accumulibacter sp. TaxID=2053492 RepID=UPI002D1B2BD8|nr:efflux RND transporter periplasmic adaptor subunit [Accumulibacter sp.]HRD90695.1 efflux RND transporter periplasmic adaptor subunit [Accumulibacter sp.]HRF73220.1 efflux RND transporter periplasmic adaptor subunit [Accumulibacter sp.]